MQYQNGGLIAVPGSQNNLSTLLFRGTLMNRVPGVPLYTQDPNSHIDPNKVFLLNPAAWTMRPLGSGASQHPTTAITAAGAGPGENASLGRIFHIWEKMNLELRGEFFNIFNRIGVPGRVFGQPLANANCECRGRSPIRLRVHECDSG